jgi:hypothetical protein
MTVVPIPAWRARRKCDDAGYRERVRVQMLEWAFGHIYHNRVDDECCPDFSCCHPELFETDRRKRLAVYRLRYAQ